MSTRPPPLPNLPPSVPPENSRLDQSVVVGIAVAIFLLLLFSAFLVSLLLQGTKDVGGERGASSGKVSDVVIGSSIDTKDESQTLKAPVQNGSEPKDGPENRTAKPDAKPSREASKSDGDGMASVETKSATANRQVEIQKFDGLAHVTTSPTSLAGNGNPFLAAVASKSTIFVVDVSPSMAGERILRVVNALVEAVNALNDSQSFLVVLFDGQMHLRKDSQGLEQATPTNKATAIRWLESYTLGGGGTEPLESVVYALAQSPELLLILSDGEFNPQYVHQITAENSRKIRRCRIDTIGLSEEVEVLQDLARKNDGIYYQAR